MKGFMSAQMHYASANGGYFGTLECLSQPADCIPGFEGPPFFDQVVQHGYRLDFYPVFYDSKLHSWAYVAIPQSWWLRDRAFCQDPVLFIVYVRSKEKSGYQCDDGLYYTDEWPEDIYKSGGCYFSVRGHECITDW